MKIFYKIKEIRLYAMPSFKYLIKEPIFIYKNEKEQQKLIFFSTSFGTVR